MTVPSLLALGGFLLLSALVATSGILFKPGAWYRGLRKPAWTPPNLAFPIVWGILYVLIAVSGWRVWREVGLATIPFGLFAVQMVLNFLWSWLFFGRRRPDLAFLDVVVLALTVAATLLAFWPIDRTAGLLLVPYLAWLGLAAALNLSVWRRNRDRGVFA
ncbi:TspO/MBR family protein [Aureimonas pseudogalii]|uniref:Tryptophan-rich sensory protein n=1 Tax=Aureimonas pseudogalii TaxID=1744844 RepID=A0A7W6EHG9_9HYPH|nr:TspO/MBR family protein [Aureimonas pseudogalii]MBB3998234.1 tryptophan-rich sensory protein [Aureimonas pseudogalii]